MTESVAPQPDRGDAPATTLSISVEDIKAAGLEPQWQSWIASGPNEPVTAEQIVLVVGQERLAETAEVLGRDPEDLAAALAADLPNLVDADSQDGPTEPGVQDAVPRIRQVVLTLTDDLSADDAIDGLEIHIMSPTGAAREVAPEAVTWTLSDVGKTSSG